MTADGMNLTMSTSGFWDKLERVTEERDTLVDRNEKLTVALKEIAGLNPGYDTAGTAVRIAKRGLTQVIKDLTADELCDCDVPVSMRHWRETCPYGDSGTEPCELERNG